MKEETFKIVSTIAIVSAATIIGLPIAFLCLVVIALDAIWG